MRVMAFLLIVAFSALVISQSALGAITFNGGSFAGENHSITSPSAVAYYKAQATAIGAGGYVSQTDYAYMEIVHFSPAYTYGGDAYTLSVISGLQNGDIVRVQEDQQYRMSSSDPWDTFYSPTTAYIKIGDYTQTSQDTILNWLVYGTNNGDGTYTLVKGSGEYWTASPGDDLTSLDGAQMRVVRDLEVWRGATLVSPQISSRGYTFGYSITGGEIVAEESFEGVALTTVPVPGVLLLTGMGAGLIGWLRRRRAV
jgi:hypothetical protein